MKPAQQGRCSCVQAARSRTIANRPVYRAQIVGGKPTRSLQPVRAVPLVRTLAPDRLGLNPTHRFCDAQGLVPPPRQWRHKPNRIAARAFRQKGTQCNT